MAREASVQLTYQNALLFYQLFYPPLIELDFTNGFDSQLISPSARWITGLVFQVISVDAVFNSARTFVQNLTLNGYFVRRAYHFNMPMNVKSDSI